MTRKEIRSLDKIILKCINGCIRNKLEFGMTNLHPKYLTTYIEIVKNSLKLYNPTDTNDFINTIYALMGETSEIHTMIGKMKIQFKRSGNYMILIGEKYPDK